MQRSIVQIMQVRMSDVHPGDVVNKSLTNTTGWFVCTELQELPNNGIIVAAASDRDSINGTIYDIVAVQLNKVVEVPSAAPRAA